MKRRVHSIAFLLGVSLAIESICFTESPAQWTPTDLHSVHVAGFAVTDGFGMNILAGTSGGVFRSTDGGIHWTAANLNAVVLAASPNAAGGKDVFAVNSNGVFRSTDGGVTWTLVNTVMQNANRLTADALGDLFAGMVGGGVWRSTDSGVNWTEVSTGLPRAFVYSLEVLPALGGSGTELFAGLDGYPPGALFRSTNHGTSWEAACQGLPPYASVNALAGSPAPGGTGEVNLFAGTDGDGVFLSTNNGASWTVSVGLAGSLVFSFAVSGRNLFAGTSNGGVFLSTNNGTSWSAVGSGLPNTHIWSLAISGTYLLAGTIGGGVWRRPISEMVTSVEDRSAEIPRQSRLEQNYPNPFNPSTTIGFKIRDNAFVSLKIFDVLGREVATLVNEVKQQGSYQVTWDAAGVPTGVYFYQLSVVPTARRDLVPTNGRDGQAGEYTETRRLLLLR